MRNIACIAIPLLFCCLAGCSTVDRVEQRTTTMNINISEAENNGILLNVARASLEEPLSFSALANYTGHQTVGATVGLPNLGFVGNPLALASLQTAGTAANGSLSNDFSYVGSDDNATYAALLQPINPTTIGYFIKQEYPRELLFFLIVSKIRVIHAGQPPHEYVNTGTTAQEVAYYHGMKQATPFEEFGTKLQSLIDSGLTAQIDISTNSRSKLCFDRGIAPLYQSSHEVHPSNYSPSCANAQVFEGTTVEKTSKDDKKSKDKKLPAPFADSYRFRDSSTADEVEIFFRSPFGIYRYLGLLVAKGNSLGILRGPDVLDPYIITITSENDGCFAAQTYRGLVFCVPSKSTTTKRVFALLHDLVKLYTFPTAAPVTISARLVPGGG